MTLSVKSNGEVNSSLNAQSRLQALIDLAPSRLIPGGTEAGKILASFIDAGSHDKEGIAPLIVSNRDGHNARAIKSVYNNLLLAIQEMAPGDLDTQAATKSSLSRKIHFKTLANLDGEKSIYIMQGAFKTKETLHKNGDRYSF